MSSLAPDFPMPAGYTWQYECIRWLQQGMHPGLVSLAHWVSGLGDDTFLLAAASVLMWSVHRALGFRALYVLICSLWIGGTVKVWSKVVRPIGIPGIRTLYADAASNYALPSGHALGAATLATLLARWFRRRDVVLAGAIMTALVGVSRVYLGLHWPLDVLVGWVMGLVIGWLGWSVGRWWTYREIPVRLRAALAVVAPAAMVILRPDGSSWYLAGWALGLGGGWLADERWLQLVPGTKLWQRVCAAVIGVAGLLALQLAMNRWPLPDWGTALYGLAAGLWAALGAPTVFRLCGLYERRPAG